MRAREAIAGYLFVLVWLVHLAVFITYPVLATFFFSFTSYNIVQPPTWIGLENWLTMFTSDNNFWIAAGNTAYFAALAVPFGQIIALLLALLLSVRVKGIGLYRTLYYLPSLAPPVAATLVFLLLFSPQQGLVNYVLEALGLPTPGWFTDPEWSKPALVLMHFWGMGSAALIFVAGVKEVPQSLLEAAAIDGAGPLRRLWHVTLPMLSPVILFNLVIGIIYSFQVFTQAYVISRTTGEPLDSTLFFMIKMYRHAFNYFQMGYAAALAAVLFLSVLALTGLVFYSSRRWVYYEAAAQER